MCQNLRSFSVCIERIEVALTFQQVLTLDDQTLLAQTAKQIWNEYWPALIGQDQTDYMVHKFQSLPAIKRDMNENAYEYWLLFNKEQELVGYTGGYEDAATNRFFISKIYLKAAHRGKGYASEVIHFYNKLCCERSLRAMYLTVNKHNELAIRAYKANQFQIIDATVTDIGNGFVMDDFIMEKGVSFI